MPGVGALEGTDADEVRLVVDRSLVLPSRIELFRKGRKVIDVRFRDLAISQQPPADAFTPTVAPGANTSLRDDGFIPTPVGAIGAKVGRTVVTPSYLPDGFVLSSAAVNVSSRSVVLSYRTGSLQLTVTLRPARQVGTQTADLFGPDASGAEKPRSLTIDSGTFAQRPAWTSTTPINHVWAAGPRSEVVVAGDTSIDSLVKVVASLQ